MSYKEFIKKQECCIKPCNNYIVDPHHVKTRGAGGKDEENLIPLCRKHHTELHTIGRMSFQIKYDLDYEKLIQHYCKEYLLQDEKP